MKLSFHGAAKMVTGSKHLVEVGNLKVLIDCGMFQGVGVEEKNFEDFKFNPKEVDFVILTHAHIDHCGLIPKLVKNGFEGKIFCTAPTRELAEIMLLDSAKIQENGVYNGGEERMRRVKGKKVRLLSKGRKNSFAIYSTADAVKSLGYFESVNYGEKISLSDKVYFRLRDAGHILGSAIVELFAEGKKIVFSGDLGHKGQVLMKDFEIIDEADYVVVESTYGAKKHESREKTVKKLFEIIEKTVERGGTVAIPSFSLERTQELIYELRPLGKVWTRKSRPGIKAFLDSPLAISATTIYSKNRNFFNDEYKSIEKKGGNPLYFEGLKFSRRPKDSQKLRKLEKVVIIAGNGMCAGGRILIHLYDRLPNPKNSLIMVGYQAEGTLGREIVGGARSVELFEERVPVRCDVHQLQGFSAHADRVDLMRWVGGFEKKRLRKIFLTHGEEEQQEEFKMNLNKKGYDVEIPGLFGGYDL